MSEHQLLQALLLALGIIASGVRAVGQRKTVSGSLPSSRTEPIAEGAISEVDYVNSGPLGPLYDFLIRNRLQRFCLLMRKANLEAYLVEGGTWTIFAPTDGSFAFLPGGTLEKLERNPQMLRDFLLYHFISGDLSKQQIIDEMVVDSVQGSPLRFNIYGPTEITTVSGAEILQPDLQFELGRLHIIDRPLYPLPQYDLIGYLQTYHNEMYKLIVSAGLVEFLSSGTYTIFAPDDKAFSYLSLELKDAMAANQTLAERIVLAHVLPASMFVRGFGNEMHIASVGNADLLFTLRRGLTFVNDIPILTPDVPVINGAVHVINRVLLPEGVDADCQCKPLDSRGKITGNVPGRPYEPSRISPTARPSSPVSGARPSGRPVGPSVTGGVRPGITQGQQRPGIEPVTGQQRPGIAPVTGQQRPGIAPVTGQQRPGLAPVTGQQRPGIAPVTGPGTTVKEPVATVSGQRTSSGTLSGHGQRPSTAGSAGLGQRQVATPIQRPGQVHAPSPAPVTIKRRPFDPNRIPQGTRPTSSPTSTRTQRPWNPPGDTILIDVRDEFEPAPTDAPGTGSPSSRPGTVPGVVPPRTPAVVSRPGTLPGSRFPSQPSHQVRQPAHSTVQGARQPSISGDRPSYPGSPSFEDNTVDVQTGPSPDYDYESLTQRPGYVGGTRTGSRPQTTIDRPGQQTPTGQRPGSPITTGLRPGQPAQSGRWPGHSTQTSQLPDQSSQTGQRPGQPTQIGQRPGQPTQTGQRPGQPTQIGQRPGQPTQIGQRPGQPTQTVQIPGQPAQTVQIPGQSTQIGQRPGQVTQIPQRPGQSQLQPIQRPGQQTTRPGQQTGFQPGVGPDQLPQVQQPGQQSQFQPDQRPGSSVSSGRRPAPSPQTPRVPVGQPGRAQPTVAPGQQFTTSRSTSLFPTRRPGQTSHSTKGQTYNPQRHNPQRRPVPQRLPPSQNSRQPASVPGATTGLIGQPFESSRQTPSCRRRGERITPATQSLPLCPVGDADIEPCQRLDQPFDPSDPRPQCQETTASCYTPGEYVDPSDIRPPCPSIPDQPECRQPGEPVDYRPLCQQPEVSNCRMPLERPLPGDTRPICVVSGRPGISPPLSPQRQTPRPPVGGQPHQPQTGAEVDTNCRRRGEPILPGDLRPSCEENVPLPGTQQTPGTHVSQPGRQPSFQPVPASQVCRQPGERVTPGDRRPLCRVSSTPSTTRPVSPVGSQVYPPTSENETQEPLGCRPVTERPTVGDTRPVCRITTTGSHGRPPSSIHSVSSRPSTPSSPHSVPSRPGTPGSPHLTPSRPGTSVRTTTSGRPGIQQRPPATISQVPGRDQSAQPLEQPQDGDSPEPEQPPATELIPHQPGIRPPSRGTHTTRSPGTHTGHRGTVTQQTRPQQPAQQPWQSPVSSRPISPPGTFGIDDQLPTDDQWSDDGSIPDSPIQQQGRPGQPQQGRPAQPQQGRPGQPQQGRPAQPQQGRPTQPQQGRPGQPQQGLPGQPQQGQPQQGRPGQPQQPQQGLPGQPQQGRPGQPQQGRPGQPQQGRPGQSWQTSGRRPGTQITGTALSLPGITTTTTTTTTLTTTRTAEGPRTLYEIVEDPALLIQGRPVKLTKIFELFKKAGLEYILTDPGPYTVFLPSDDAFLRLPKGVIEQLESDPNLLQQVLLFHVTTDEVLPGPQDQSFIVQSFQGTPLLITMLKGGRLILISGAKAVAVTRASNGLFYVINQLIYPLPQDDIVSALSSRPDLKTLTTFIEITGLTDYLRDQPYTLFAPSDNAFNQLSEAAVQELMQNTTALRDLLLGHVISGAHYGREFLSGVSFPNMRGGTLKLGTVSFGYQVNNVNIKTPEIVTGGGVIHIIDEVLLTPEDLRFIERLSNALDGVDPPPSSNLEEQPPASTPGTQANGNWRTHSTFTVTYGRTQSTRTQTIPGTMHTITQGSPYPQDGSLTRGTIPIQGSHALAPGLSPQTGHGSGAHVPASHSQNMGNVRVTSLSPASGVQRQTSGGGFAVQSHTTSQTGHQTHGSSASGQRSPVQSFGTAGHQTHGTSSGLRGPGQSFVTTGRYSVVQLANDIGLNRFASLITNSGLSDKIEDGGTYTVLAPTDEALNSLPPDVAQALEADPNQLRDLLQYHILPQKLSSSSLGNDETASTLLEGQKLRFNKYNNGQVLTALGVPVDNTQADPSTAVRIIPVNQVLQPPSGNLLKIVESTPDLSEFYNAIKSAHLGWMLNGQNGMTLFAPSNAAFQSLTDEQRKDLIENKRNFSDILKSHLVRVTLYTMGLQDGEERRTENRKTVVFHFYDGGVTVNSIPIVHPDIPATNGVLHIIDQFL